MAGHKIIFEGAELAGKSYLMQQVYDQLEPKYNSGGRALDGCHWFNCDIGLWGTTEGAQVLDKYLEILGLLAQRHVLVEKFHLSEAVYQKLYRRQEVDFSVWEKRLALLGAKIVLVTLPENEELIQRRLDDRLRLYPHYARIAQKPADYIRQQQLYQLLLQKSMLPHYIVNTHQLPDDSLLAGVLDFLL